MCDPEGLLPCEHQAVVLYEPIAATGVSLTYSTEWADGRTDRPSWNADSLGLGGWSLDVLQRYDPEHGILLAGDGSWRIAAAADIGDGQRAVPTYDGFEYFVFDAAWRHVRTVDSITGTTLLTLELRRCRAAYGGGRPDRRHSRRERSSATEGTCKPCWGSARPGPGRRSTRKAGLVAWCGRTAPCST